MQDLSRNVYLCPSLLVILGYFRSTNVLIILINGQYSRDTAEFFILFNYYHISEIFINQHSNTEFACDGL